MSLSLSSDNAIKFIKSTNKKIKKRSLTITKKYPAVVKDDLTLSQAIYSPVERLT